MSGKKGMKRTVPVSRPDKQVQTAKGDNSKYIQHSLSLAALPQVDVTDPVAVEKRVITYFEMCAEADMKPSVAGLAVAFGTNRTQFWRWANHIDCAYMSDSVCNAFKKGYDLLNLQMEDYMLNGKINPVAGIFMMKNNFGYKDQTEQIVHHDSDRVGNPDDIAARYRTDSVIDITPSDSSDSPAADSGDSE